LLVAATRKKRTCHDAGRDGIVLERLTPPEDARMMTTSSGRRTNVDEIPAPDDERLVVDVIGERDGCRHCGDEAFTCETAAGTCGTLDGAS
jgi:hypothetical protein